MPSKFPCLGQKKLKYNATYPCPKGFLQSFIKLRSHGRSGFDSLHKSAQRRRHISDAASGQVAAWPGQGLVMRRVWGRGRNWSRGGSYTRAGLGHGARWDVGTMEQGLGRGDGEIMCS